MRRVAFQTWWQARPLDPLDQLQSWSDDWKEKKENKMPIVELQASIAECLRSACTAEMIEAKDDPVRAQAALYIRRAALACRTQVADSLSLLRKIEQTSSSVLDIFPDLELAVSEAEPELAQDFFAIKVRPSMETAPNQAFKARPPKEMCIKSDTFQLARAATCG